MKQRNQSLVLLAILGLILLLPAPNALAAGELDLGNAQSAAVRAADIGLGGNAFQFTLQKISTGMVVLMRVIATCFIMIGGLMVAFNVESANKLLWNSMLGIGLALNFFSVITGLFDVDGFAGVQQPFSYQFDLAKDGDGAFNFITPFVREYENYCKEGARVIAPVACKLLLCLTGICGGLKIALGMISGDKMKFLIETVMKTGFFMFLILNWFNGDYNAGGIMKSSGMNLMGSLMEGFRELGFRAGGFITGVPNNDIIAVGTKMFLKGMSAAEFSITSPFMSLAALIALIVMVILLFLTGLEMVMARLEFVTLAMISTIMIPWGALQQTQFLFTSTISAMFSLAVKVSVIAFIEAMSCTILNQYCEKFTAAAHNGNIIGNFPLLLQIIFISLLLYFITRKIPELASSLISGQPSLGAGSMISTARTMGAAAAGGALGAMQGASMAHTGYKMVKDGGFAGFKAAGSNLAEQTLLGRKDGYSGFRQGGMFSSMANSLTKGIYSVNGYPEKQKPDNPTPGSSASMSGEQKIDDAVLAEMMKRYGG